MNNPEELAKFIDYTNLDNTSTKEEITAFCEKAKEYNFYSVVISPCYVKLAAEILKDTDIKIGTVIGFPLGFETTESKVCEAKTAIKNGADEIDMMINLPAVRSHDFELVESDIKEIRKATEGKVLKVIIEDPILNNDEKAIVSRIINDAKADFIKTASGFNGIEKFYAIMESLKIIRKNSPNAEMKVAGGIRDYKTTSNLLAAGATRIGTSAGDKIIDTLKHALENHDMDPNKKTGPQLI